MSTLYTMVAPCFFGTESTLNFEVKRLGAQNIQVTDGRVAFQGGADMIAAANLNLRTAERVLLLLATYKATTFDELFDGCYAIAWEELLPANAAFPVKGSSLSSQLSSVPACQSIVKKAIVKRLMNGHKVGTLPEDGALYKIRFALRKDTVEIYLDTSGDGLHKRGYRKNATLAPIKETLAAAIADLGRVRRDSLVQDPFCGSGTLVIEAAQKALNLAPGLRRRFAAEQEAQNIRRRADLRKHGRERRAAHTHVKRKDKHRVERDIHRRAEHHRAHGCRGKALAHRDLVESVAQHREHRTGNVGRKIRLGIRPQRLAAPEGEQNLPPEHEQRHGREHAEREQQIKAVRGDLPRAVHVAPPHADAHERAAAEADERTDGGYHRHDRRTHADAGERVRSHLRDMADIHAVHDAV